MTLIGELEFMMQVFEAKEQVHRVEKNFDNQEMLHTQGINFLNMVEERVFSVCVLLFRKCKVIPQGTRRTKMKWKSEISLNTVR